MQLLVRQHVRVTFYACNNIFEVVRHKGTCWNVLLLPAIVFMQHASKLKDGGKRTTDDLGLGEVQNAISCFTGCK